MRAKGTIVFMFYLISALIVAAVFSYAFRDLFSRLQVDNIAILGDAFRLNTLLAGSLSLVLAVFFGVFYRPSRQYIEQCVVEFDKVAFPEWKETKMATFTVVLVSIVASMILGVFDLVFSWWTSNNLFIW
jgi:preprotein translocase subunit SecE